MSSKFDLTFKSLDELPTFAGAVASGDFLILWDASQNKFVKVDATRVTFA